MASAWVCVVQTGRLSIRDDIDLEQHAIDTGQSVSDTTVQEICVMKPEMHSLNLSGCREVLLAMSSR